MSPSVSVRLLLTQSDARLVELARAGHERAFEALVARYRGALLGYCRHHLLGHDRAEDALQHGLLQAWLALREGVEVRHVRPWLYSIVHNTALNMRRSGYSYAQLSETLCGAGAPAEDLERRIAVREALAGLAALPQMQREALLRTAVDGSTYLETATELGLSENAVRGLVHRARVTLRTATTALTPPPLLNWLLGPGPADAPLSSRLAEVGAGGGGAGLTAGLLKLAATAATAGVVMSGVGVPHHHRHPRAELRRRATTSALASYGGAPPQTRTLRALAHGVASGRHASAGAPVDDRGRAHHRQPQPPSGALPGAARPTALRDGGVRGGPTAPADVALAGERRPQRPSPQPLAPAGRGDALAAQPGGEGSAAPDAHGGRHGRYGGRGGDEGGAGEGGTGDGGTGEASNNGSGQPGPATPGRGHPSTAPTPFGGGSSGDDTNTGAPGSGPSSGGNPSGEGAHGGQRDDGQRGDATGSEPQAREASGSSDSASSASRPQPLPQGIGACAWPRPRAAARGAPVAPRAR